MWNLPRPEIQPVSPALAGSFLSTVSPCLLFFFFLSFFFLSPWSVWDLSSLTRDRTCAPAWGVYHHHRKWTTREVPPFLFWPVSQCFQHLLCFRGDPCLKIEVLPRPWYKFLVKANGKYSKKWHFTRKLPESGAVVVKRGQRPVLSPHGLITSTPQDSITSCGWLSDPQQTVWITLCTLALVTQQVQTAGFLAVHPLPRYYSS